VQCKLCKKSQIEPEINLYYKGQEIVPINWNYRNKVRNRFDSVLSAMDYSLEKSLWPGLIKVYYVCSKCKHRELKMEKFVNGM